ncbi:hypothetical protein Hs30E_03360 [Lactococcus hodotermopsidis]|uniref:DUF1934 domain-containing protein n=1 Tax=Pseudolactococcus hodotermopsidis TaxID=2709157 RepID=A0A6A0BAV5_9LACT|nr:DUF1934 domain-containing protein [Lactococcus hodotermopsidis]GFH41785.1 hypothetical protein Hs30E_03360 [Lactococcus hodotermopsidis]
MTKIIIDNLIEIDSEKEEIHEEFSGEFYEKNDMIFLVYQNELNEKVVMKYNEKMLIMTRFSKPNMIMKLLPDINTTTAIATPLGLQRFEIRTQSYEKLSDGCQTQYQFWQHERLLAQYVLRVRFE